MEIWLKIKSVQGPGLIYEKKINRVIWRGGVFNNAYFLCKME